MTIVPAKPSDLKNIKNLTEACAIEMEEQQIFQWNEHYPSLEKIAADIEKKELYVVKAENELRGIIALTDLMNQEYISIEWLTESKNNLYVHRLATHPEYWGKGYGRKLMDFAEQYAREHNYQSIRLDTFSQNQRNLNFYERRGYQRPGDIFLPRQSAFPFYCYELIL